MSISKILKDTLVLYELPAWRKTEKEKTSRVVEILFFRRRRGLIAPGAGRFRAGTPEFGEAVETYLMHELISHSEYVSQEPHQLLALHHRL